MTSAEVKEAEDRVSKTILKNAETMRGHLNGKSLKPLAIAVAQDVIDTRVRMTKEKIIALAKEHGVEENLVHEMTTNAFGFDAVLGRKERGDKDSRIFLRQPGKATVAKKPSRDQVEWPERFSRPTEKKGDIKKTMTGRETTPFPLIAMETKGRARNSVKRHHAWLAENAVEEARARGDEINLRMFEDQQKAKKLSPGDVDSMQSYLFEWEVQKQPKPITTP